MATVLFVCLHNAGRSQMSKALFERAAGGRHTALSAGTSPSEHVHPEVVDVMRELNVDLAGERPRLLTDALAERADVVVTMGCGDACPYVPTTVDAWDLPDPAGRPIDEVREIRDLIDRHAKELVTDKINAIHADTTAHRFRLERLLPNLISEFADTRPPEVIRGCADRILAEYDDVPIRSHILTIAQKQTRDCLRQDTCAVLQTAE